MEPLPPVSKQELKDITAAAIERIAENEARVIYSAVLAAANSGNYLYKYVVPDPTMADMSGLIALKVKRYLSDVNIVPSLEVSKYNDYSILIRW